MLHTSQLRKHTKTSELVVMQSNAVGGETKSGFINV